MPASIRVRLLISLLVVAVASAGVLSWYFLRELEGYGLRKLEERLGSEARLVSAVAGATGLRNPEELEQALQDAVGQVNSRLRVLDANGVAVADSAAQGDVGTDFSQRPEIQRALDGHYGAYSRLTPGNRLALYVAYPVWHQGQVIGVGYSSAETFSIVTLLRDYRTRLGSFVVLFAVATLILAEVLARWMSRPLRQLEAKATAFAGGDHEARVRPGGSRETRAVGEAFNTMADEIERVVDELKKEERLKSRFVSDVSHELRSPLTAIRGTAETLLEGDVEDEDAQRFLATIVREAERLSRLADDLLALQRIEGATGELPVRRVELADVVRGAMESLEHLTSQRDVRVEVDGEAPAVLGDPDRLQQVIGNLIDNASRHMPGGGTVRVGLAREDAFAVVTVTDEGPGIAEDALPHVFDRFYRAQESRDRSTGGAGLGLAIVKAIVDRHAGSITAENVPEGGARFTVRLPALRDS